MEAKALSFVLRAASSEHDKSSTRRVFTYVVGGRVGMNDTCYFTLDMKKLVIPPTSPTRMRGVVCVQFQGALSSHPPTHPTHRKQGSKVKPARRKWAKIRGASEPWES